MEQTAAPATATEPGLFALVPLKPRITKSTALAAITARIPSTAHLLKRYEIAKGMANLWDGERDGLRAAVQNIPNGQYDDVVLSRTETAAVHYTNAEGKHQVESCLQTTIPAPKERERTDEESGVVSKIGVVALQLDGVESPEELVDTMLHLLQKGKDVLAAFVRERWIGSGDIVDNDALYKKDPGEKMQIVVLPPETPI